jgi:hypothetical protein
MPATRTVSTLAVSAALIALVVAAATRGDQFPVASWLAVRDHEAHEEDGYAAARARRQDPDAIEAAFPRESYRPGTIATLRIWTRAWGTTLRVYRVGPERRLTHGDKTMEGVPVTAARRVTGSSVRVLVGNWPSGLYFVKLTSPRRVGFAPFVVRPRRLGEHRVAVVLPTRTWQAYNFRDDDGDGSGDTWYATRDHLQARLGRPFLNRGVPPHYRRYDGRFLRWLHRSGKRVDVLSQADLDRSSAHKLRLAYELLVFPGHHEYVTAAEYDAVEGFRDLGGDLMFLSANNFFWRVDVRSGLMTRVAKWRDLGRPEAALIGVQYVGNDRGERQGPWRVTRTSASRWLFRDVPLEVGGAFSKGGVEIDAVTASSPPQTQVVATIPDLLGPGMTANMSYYELPNGARAFAAGAFTLAGLIYQRPVQRLLENLWARLAPRPAQRAKVGVRSTHSRRVGNLPPETLRGVAHELDQYPTLAAATRVQRAVADQLLAEMQAAARRWQDPQVAASEGYDMKRPRRRRDETRVMWFHAEFGGQDDRAGFDPQRPGTLVYADVPGRPLVLVGVMFSMPRGLEGPVPGGAITRWHWHRVCVEGNRRGLAPRADGTCPAGSELRDGSQMMHVWFTGDLRSAYAIHAPVPELCLAALLPSVACDLAEHRHD